MMYPPDKSMIKNVSHPSETEILKTLNELFKKQIVIKLNESRGIIELKTYGFNPEVSYKLNKYLLNQVS